MIHLLLTIFMLNAAYIDLYQQGQRLLDKGNIGEAETVLTQAANANPAYVPTLKALAELYVKSRRFTKAINQYQHIVNLTPRDVNAKGRLAELYSWIGDYDKAIVIYREALEIDNRNMGLKTDLAKVLRWSHRYDEAEQFYNDVLRSDPAHHDALKGLAKTYSMSGDLASARNILDKAIKIYPDDAELYKEKGNVLAWQKDFHRAIEALQKSLDLAQNNADGYRTMGDVYFWMKDYQKSVEAYKKASIIEPDNIETHVVLARTYRAMGKNLLAEEHIKTALRINPFYAEATQLLAEIKGDTRYLLIKTVGDIVELLSYLFVFILVIYVYRRKKRILRRKHKIYSYFVKFVLPAFAILNFAIYVGGGALSRWLDIELLHSFSETVLLFALGISFLALLWTEHRSTELIETVILAIGAHPDDIELGCGGFLLKAKDSGARVYGLMLTRGEKGTDEKGKRDLEISRSTKFMEMDGSWVMDFPDTKLRENILSIKNVIEEKIKETKATMVLTHSAIDTHSDHQAVFTASNEAARNVAAILCYEDVSTPREFVPNYYIDITGYIDDKLKLVSLHKTQELKTYMDPEIIKGRAAHRGLQIGVSYAEAFRAHKILK